MGRMYAGRNREEKLWVWLMEAIYLKVKHDYFSSAMPSRVYGRDGDFGAAWNKLQLETSLVDKTVLIVCNSLYDPKPRVWFQEMLENTTLQGTDNHNLFKFHYNNFAALAGRQEQRPGSRSKDTVLEYQRAAFTFAHLTDADITKVSLFTYEETVQLLANAIAAVKLYLILRGTKRVYEKSNKLREEGEALVAQMYNSFLVK